MPTATTSGAPHADKAGKNDKSEKPEKHVLRLHGSNTLGFSVAPRPVKAFLEHEGAKNVFVNEGAREEERIWVQARLPKNREVSVEIHAPGTKVGFESLEKGHCDIALASRPIKPEEAKELQALGDLTSPSSEFVVGVDGIAVIVHPSNPIAKLTMKQLEQIFSGDVTNWSQVGGPNRPIRVLSRDKRSGTHDAFVSEVMHGRPLRAEETFDDSEALSHAVQASEGNIGFVGLPYVQKAKAVAVQDGDAAALLPTPFTVATEDYRLSRRLFFYVPANPSEPMTRELVEFALSEQGQAIVAEAGFVPLSLRSEKAAVPTGAPPRYAKLASNATRLSVNFRFKLGSSALDTKGLRDLDRLAQYLASPLNRGRHVALAGFADAQGNETTNAEVSKQRAEAIAGLLRQRGVSADDVASFGSALPVAPNDSPEGRSRNRRVEVWLR